MFFRVSDILNKKGNDVLNKHLKRKERANSNKSNPVGSTSKVVIHFKLSIIMFCTSKFQVSIIRRINYTAKFSQS